MKESGERKLKSGRIKEAYTLRDVYASFIIGMTQDNIANEYPDGVY